MSDTELKLYSTMQEAMEAAVAKFNAQAVDAITAAIPVARFYVQGFGAEGTTTNVVTVVGSAYGLPVTHDKFVAGAKVVGSFTITRDYAVALTMSWQQQFGITDKEIADAREAHLRANRGNAQ